mgnify:FL=1
MITRRGLFDLVSIVIASPFLARARPISALPVIIPCRKIISGIRVSGPVMQACMSDGAFANQWPLATQTRNMLNNVSVQEWISHGYTPTPD